VIEELQKPTPLGVGCGTAIETCNSQSPLLLVVGIYPTLFIYKNIGIFVLTSISM
jgi:hypothetical protein